MTEMRNKYDKRINNFMQKLSDKEDEIARLRGDLRDSTIFQRSSIPRSPDVGQLIDSTIFQGHNRSLTPNSNTFMQHNNSIQMGSVIDHSGGSLRSSLNCNKNIQQNNSMIDNFNRAECRNCCNGCTTNYAYKFPNNDL